MNWPLRLLGRIAGSLYHRWYYGAKVWSRITWDGVPVLKSPSDMWNYQEILFSLRPSLVIEFGSWAGGSAVFFAGCLRQAGKPFKILSVDIDHSRLNGTHDDNICFLTANSASPEVSAKIAEMRDSRPVFAILDSDHSKEHVLAEMTSLRPLLRSGDYLVVEDSNINGHPVLRSFGPGPYEAIEEYFRLYPNDYTHDTERENKFGWTFAPKGFLIRR